MAAVTILHDKSKRAFASRPQIYIEEGLLAQWQQRCSVVNVNAELPAVQLVEIFLSWRARTIQQLLRLVIQFQVRASSTPLIARRFVALAMGAVTVDGSKSDARDIFGRESK